MPTNSPQDRYTWVTEKELGTCGECGGKLELLVVQPPRSFVYLNQIIMCDRCKKIIT